MHHSLYVLLKTSNVCNLRCAYCYDDCAGPPQLFPPEGFRMLLSQLSHLPQSRIVLAWHGGEPLLAGIDYFKELLAIQKSSTAAHQQIYNCLHTNGVALNSRWVDWLAANEFSVSISLDGPKDFHDLYRRTTDNRGSFDDVLDAMALLRQSFLSVNVSVTVRDDSWTVVSDLYELCKRLGVETIKFWPLLACHHNNTPIQSVTPEAYRLFATSLCSLWLADKRGGIAHPAVLRFEDILARASGEAAANCWFDPNLCYSNLMVTLRGDVYPCDLFNGVTAWKLGNIYERDLDEMLKRSKRQYLQAADLIPSQCSRCRFRALCRGGCPYQRFLADSSFTSSTPYCSTHVSLFQMLLGNSTLSSRNGVAKDQRQC